MSVVLCKWDELQGGSTLLVSHTLSPVRESDGAREMERQKREQRQRTHSEAIMYAELLGSSWKIGFANRAQEREI